MPLTSSVMRQSISNFRLYCCSKKIQMLRKNVKLLLEQLQVCIFAEIVFGVRCTLTQRRYSSITASQYSWLCLMCYVCHSTFPRRGSRSTISTIVLPPEASSYSPITFSMFTSCLKRLISSIGLDPANYSPHSFRRGGATFAF